MTPAPLDCFAITAPGLEAVTAAELSGLGLAPEAIEPGGVTFRADARGLYAANLHLRTASRVVLRIARFHASAFHELERRARRVEWNAYVAPGSRVAFRVTARKSRLYHQSAIAERLVRAVGLAVPGVEPDNSGNPDPQGVEAPNAQLFVVRFFHDECTISADSSGALLHRRGYRLETAKAPLRETLAAAMLLGAGWDGSRPCLDPLCGSGTIAIEAALLARRIPPGLRRAFAFQRWPQHDPDCWSRLLAQARSEIRPKALEAILASDRDRGAVAAAIENSVRAGVADTIVFRRTALSGIEPPPGSPGWVITNPPYGVRVGDRRGLRDLYAQLGHVLRAKCSDWRLAMLSADPGLERQTGLPLESCFRTTNGGLKVRLVVTPSTLQRQPAQDRSARAAG